MVEFFKLIEAIDGFDSYMWVDVNRSKRYENYEMYDTKIYACKVCILCEKYTENYLDLVYKNHRELYSVYEFYNEKPINKKLIEDALYTIDSYIKNFGAYKGFGEYVIKYKEITFSPFIHIYKFCIYVKRYIYDALGWEYSQESSSNTNKEQALTDRAKKYFAKAVNNGLMKKSDNGYKWLHNSGSKASLGYFLNKVYNPNSTTTIPFKYLESLFNVKRLDVSLNHVLDAKNPQKWRKDIDVIFKD